MSQSQQAFSVRDCADERSGSIDGRDTETPVQELLDVLDDASCRAILEATSDAALSATEVSETCDLPPSTTYRKLDLLTDVGLLEERTRVQHSGKHPREYVRSVTDVVISITAHGETEVQVTHHENVEETGTVHSASDD